MQFAKAFVLTANGAKIPAIGFGTMELPHRPAELVAAAIAAGYRHIDTARKYGTEENLLAIEREQISAYIPSPDSDHRTEFFSANRFRYEAERDVYLCPAGPRTAL